MAEEVNENSSPALNFLEITEGATAYLRFIAELGGMGFDLSDQSRAAIASWSIATSKNTAASDIFNNFIKCRQCALAGQRQHVIHGRGNPDARLMIIGGIPEHEDAQTGKPYSGRAGALLDKILAAMTLSRDDVYLTFAVKCCLPDLTNPNTGVVNSCRAYLKKELIRVRPDIIFTFGEVAASSLLETSAPLARLRGRFHDYKGIPLMPTHAPEYLMKNVDAKREAWEDIKQVMNGLKN
ncbi:MAG: uracil-DNA glycosylase [Desulfosalsimonadaceae bacterium]|nr:uracil-DNA glycosylase [Desulfosalsimonadaceae bacterium]